MKVLALVVCVLFVGSSQAGLVDDLKAQLSGVGDLFKGVGAHLQTAGSEALKQLLEQAKQAGNTLLQTTILKLLEGLGTQVPGKRELGILEQLENSRQWLENHFEKAKGEVDEVLTESVGKLKAAGEKVFNLEFLENEKPEEILEEIENALQHQSSVTRGFVEKVFRELLENVKPTPDKRFIKDTLQNLVDFFNPHVENIKKVFSNFAGTIKGHATNVLSVLQSKTTELRTAMDLLAAELKGKLAGHVDQLKKHGEQLKTYGKDAYQALLAAVTDILSQTATNVAETSKTAITGTLQNVAKTITDQLIELVAQSAN